MVQELASGLLARCFRGERDYKMIIMCLDFATLDNSFRVYIFLFRLSNSRYFVMRYSY